MNPKVDKFLKDKKHPLTTDIQLVRKIILQTSYKIEEDIKWSFATFLYKDNIASFFVNAKNHVSLMFHKGALIRDEFGVWESVSKRDKANAFCGYKGY